MPWSWVTLSYVKRSLMKEGSQVVGGKSTWRCYSHTSDGPFWGGGAFPLPCPNKFPSRLHSEQKESHTPAMNKRLLGAHGAIAQYDGQAAVK